MHMHVHTTPTCICWLTFSFTRAPHELVLHQEMARLDKLRLEEEAIAEKLAPVCYAEVTTA